MTEQIQDSKWPTLVPGLYVCNLNLFYPKILFFPILPRGFISSTTTDIFAKNRNQKCKHWSAFFLSQTAVRNGMFVFPNASSCLTGVNNYLIISNCWQNNMIFLRWNSKQNFQEPNHSDLLIFSHLHTCSLFMKRSPCELYLNKTLKICP